MLSPELSKFLFQYNSWANRRILDACSALPNEQFTRDLGSSYGSVRDTLAHVYGAEWVWKERIEGRSPSGVPGGDGFPDFAAVRARLEEMDQYYVNFTSSLTADNLQRLLSYKLFTGAETSNPLWQTLHQLSNHGTYHRGQVVTMLRQLGAKGVSTDVIGLYREQAASAKA